MPSAARHHEDRKRPADRAWKSRHGRTQAAVAAEQDRAAGGRHRRSVDLGGGRVARASVELRVLSRTQSVHAYLRWSDGGKSRSRQLGEVTEDTRAKNLASAWQRARTSGLLLEDRRPAGSWASSREVRASMQGNKSRDTGPEIRLRSLLHANGLRYRVSTRPLPDVARTADIVFPGAHVAVFVDGCYWHGCASHYRAPATNSEFWREKISGNQRRDLATNRLLEEAGWTVIRAWEHEDPTDVAERVMDTVQSSKDQNRSGSKE